MYFSVGVGVYTVSMYFLYIFEAAPKGINDTWRPSMVEVPMV